ncbi:hypothetical protein [Cohnella sp. WQ 127256]|uniref:hypothetical protein n=1 Tax=Cohnella sp. WQ 127256 TaxID=2938790 RepID=UPI002119A010|nr:hypothetical protein [Cohnella sp. WQ 127256]
MMNLRKIPKVIVLGLLTMMLFSLTGCLYPDDQSKVGNGSARESVLVVQDAVDRYQEKTGVLPMQNADAKTLEYEKFRVDFGKLKRMDFIAQVPSTAFENGGGFQFLIIDEEMNPLVKLLDLAVFQAVTDVQKKVDAYRTSHANQNPSGDELYPGFQMINFKKLNMSEPKIKSMFSNQSLNLLVNEQGQVLVDYGTDVMAAVKKLNDQPQPEVDLRRVLIEASYFVPVRSPVYHWVNGEPLPVRA